MEKVYISIDETVTLIKKLIEETGNKELKNLSINLIAEMEKLYNKGNYFQEIAEKFREDWKKNYSIYKKNKSDLHRRIATQQYKKYKEYYDFSAKYFEQLFVILDSITKSLAVIGEGDRIKLLSKLTDFVRVDPVKNRAEYMKHKKELDTLVSTITLPEEVPEEIESEMEREFEEAMEKEYVIEELEDTLEPETKKRRKVSRL